MRYSVMVMFAMFALLFGPLAMAVEKPDSPPAETVNVPQNDIIKAPATHDLLRINNVELRKTGDTVTPSDTGSIKIFVDKQTMKVLVAVEFDGRTVPGLETAKTDVEQRAISYEILLRATTGLAAFIQAELGKDGIEMKEFKIPAHVPAPPADRKIDIDTAPAHRPDAELQRSSLLHWATR